MWVEVGYVSRAHGVTGELRVVLHSPDEGLPESVEKIRLKKGQDSKKYVIERARGTKDALLLRLMGVGTREAAAALKGFALEVEEGQLPEVEGREHYLFEVVGATVAAPNGESHGTIESFLHTDAHPIAVLKHEGRERLVPWVEDFFVSFDRETDSVVMEVPEDLWDDAEKDAEPE
jgi:16S rRNA processing protein RimM